MLENIQSKLSDLEASAASVGPDAGDAINNPLASVEIVGIAARDSLPHLRPAVIADVIREGGKMILSGDSKAGKTFLLMELAIDLAFGRDWCGMDCSKSSVLYVNLELSDADFAHRCRDILDKLGIEEEVSSDKVGVFNARGKASNAKSLVAELLKRLNNGRYDVVIIDPIYKVQDGDENSAQAITALAHELDRLAEEGRCTVIYSHHHPKHSTGSIASINRGAGSGVFGRDADASIDLIQLDAPDNCNPSSKAFRMEFDLRSFRWHPPVNIWFEDGIHRVDDTGVLEGCGYANHARSSRQHAAKKDAKLVKIEAALDELIGEGNEISAKVFRDEINRPDGAHYIPGCKGNRTIRSYVEQSERFKWVQVTPTCSAIRKKETAGGE